MHEEWMIQIKSCVWYNLLKADFVPHTITVVFWDSRMSASQDKIIYNMKTKHTRSCSANYSMSLSLSLTQNEKFTKNSHWESFSPKIVLWMRDYKKLYVIEQTLCFNNNYCHRLTDSKIKIIKYYNLDK